MSGTTPHAAKPANRESWLLRISSARWNYVLSFVTDAGIAVGFLAWAVLTIERPAAAVPVVAAALVFYSLLEYGFHRVLFHARLSPRVFRVGHAKHHASPRARLAMPFFVPLGPAVIVFALASAAVGSSLGALFTGISALGYFSYDSLHHLVHTPSVQWPPVPWLRAVHDVHHVRAGRNFGVTTPLWDIILGTWTAPAKD
jgi:sterol desaturase/sphingolipid hydroxylase (fatty acid hydroxylase superfamily)